MSLEWLFKMFAGPKEEGRPGRDRIASVARFADDDYLRAARFLRDFKGKLTGAKSQKVLFLYEEAGRKFLELAEIGVDGGDATHSRGRGYRERRV